MSRNNDPFQPWNDPIRKNDPFMPHNDPCYRDDPTKPWNSPFGNESELNDDERRKYGI